VLAGVDELRHVLEETFLLRLPESPDVDRVLQRAFEQASQ
jgi:hypothetical protein